MSELTPSEGSQTLSRGIRLLEVVASTDQSPTIDELSRSVGLHRSVTYRLLRTLEHHGLLSRTDSGKVTLGAGLTALASSVSRDIQQVAIPLLDVCANDLGMTCILVIQLDASEAMTLTSASPRNAGAVVSYRPGHRHPLSSGAPGKAILASLADARWPESARTPEVTAEIATVRERGYATSHGEVVASLHGIAVPLNLPGHAPASVAAVHISLPDDEAKIAERLKTLAADISRALGN